MKRFLSVVLSLVALVGAYVLAATGSVPLLAARVPREIVRASPAWLSVALVTEVFTFVRGR